MPQVTGNTIFVGVFGHPIAHSLSPHMHNAAFDALGMDWVYLAFDVHPEKLRQALLALSALGMKGVNLTIPHKEAAARIVDELSPSARVLEAVNTVCIEGEKLLGYNTDVNGFLHSLSEAGVDPAGKKALLLGAGGAARAISLALIEKRVKSLLIANRTAEKAVNLAEILRKTASDAQIRSCALSAPSLEEEVENVEMIVNATSVGMYPESDAQPLLPTKRFHSNQIIVDIVYQPAKTRLLIEAAERGCLTINGVKMLVWQGAEAFSLWTGQEAPTKVMEKALLEALNNKMPFG